MGRARFLQNHIAVATQAYQLDVPWINLADEVIAVTNFAVAGAQWGDEGKGKVVDVLAPRFDYVVRFQGGPNAGHSVVFNGDRFALHVLPSGIFQPNTRNVIANGVVVDPEKLVVEIEGLRARGIVVTPNQLAISDRAHLIMPYHIMLDRHREDAKGRTAIGTTGRGIGPAYEWKAGRRGIRFCDVRSDEVFRGALERELNFLRQHFTQIDELADWPADRMFAKLKPAIDQLRPFITDSVSLLAQARQAGKSLLFEGAQATLLDIDFGTYPYVTSSNSCSLGVTAGAGVPARTIQRVIGIFKAYCTRVGHGPFPTELHDETGEKMRVAGAEFGTTTGRPRRCGWLDLVSLNYTHQLNGFDSLAIMKMDVLDGLEEISICEAYELDGQVIETLPAGIDDLTRIKPKYRKFPGWQTDLSGLTRYEDLPAAARTILDFIEERLNCPIGLISVGPDRTQTIIREKAFFG